MKPDQMIYFVLVNYDSGPAWAERPVERMDRKTTVQDIATGQFDARRDCNVLRVMECNPVESICHIVTEDILREAGKWEVANGPMWPADCRAANFDHVRDLRKHEVA